MARPLTSAAVAVILTPGRVLTSEDVAALEPALLPPAQVRARRLDGRDAAIRAAIAALGKRSRTEAAIELARLLRRYATGPQWIEDRAVGAPPDRTSELRKLLHTIVVLNRGAPLGWRQIIRAATGQRTPEHVING